MEAKPSDADLKAKVTGVLVKLKELEVSSEWEQIASKPCEMYKMGIDSRVASKGIAVVNFPISKIIQFLEKQDTLKRLNPQLLELSILYEVKDSFRVNYMQYKGIWPVANRDFVNVSQKTIESPTKAYIGTIMCDYPCPEEKGVVRGQIFVGGYIIEAIDEKTTRVTYISDIDLKGSIPGLIKNQLSQKQGEIASRIEPVLKGEKW